MNKLLKVGFIVLALLLLVGLLLVWMLPTAVEALPGQIRVRLPEEILRAVTTPLPTALPPPARTPASGSLTATDLIPIPPTALSEVVPTEPVEVPEETRNDEISVTAAVTPIVPAAAAPVESRNDEISATDTPPATHHPPLANRHFLTGLKIVPQKLNNCGPATLSINLNYYGLDLDQFDVAGVVKPHYDDRNVSPEELVAYTNQYTDLEALLYRGGQLDVVKALIAAGFPVVIEKGYEPDDWQGWMGHYLTLYGYDEEAQTFDTMDTYLGPWDSSGRSVTYEEIAAGWQAFNYAFYIVHPADQETAVRAITGPDLNDEQLMWQQAMGVAYKNIDEQPNNAFAWFNLGSSLTHLGQLQGNERLLKAAATAFDQARIIGLPPRMLWYQFEPYEAYLAAGRPEEVMTLTAAVLDNAGGRDVEETYLYRGHARLAQGDPQGARSDYRRALELRPTFPAAQDALEELRRRKTEDE